MPTTTTTTTPVDYFSVMAFDAVGNGEADDTAALQTAINAASAGDGATEGPAGFVYAPPGFRFKTTAPLVINTPIRLYFGSYIYYAGATGSAVIVNSLAPVAGRNTGFDLEFVGLRAVNGNTAAPTGINASGTIGVEVRTMQFSRLRVGEAIGFTKYGVYLNSTNDTYTGQHVQDNEIELGQIAYNGAGLFANSYSAAEGACQTNRISIQDIFTNWINLQVSDASHIDTSDNIFVVNAMDAPAPGGSAVELYGAFNSFRFGYLDGAINAQPLSRNNRVVVENTVGTGVAFSDAGSNNWMMAGTPQVGQLPATVGITSGAVHQNTYGVPIIIYATVNLPNRAQAQLNVGATRAPPLVSKATNAAGVGAIEVPFSFLVPPGHFWSFVSVGAVAYTAATIYQAS